MPEFVLDEGCEPSIGSIIEGEIIPRLLAAHGEIEQRAPPERSMRVCESEAERFETLPLSMEADELLDQVDLMLARGASVESIFVDVLARSARRLGTMWEEDSCTFVDVTVGLWRLQETMRAVARRAPPIIEAVTAPRSIMLAPMPGDQHSFGTLMIEQVFLRAGWESELLFDPSRKDILTMLASRQFDIAGLTLSCDHDCDDMRQFVASIRSVSANPAIRIMVGGRAVGGDESLAREMGADGTALDAESALDLADSLVPLTAGGNSVRGSY